jgi:hypothetical protein
MAGRAIAFLIKHLENQFFRAKPAKAYGKLNQPHRKRIGTEQGGPEPAGNDQKYQTRAETNYESRGSGLAASQYHAARIGFGRHDGRSRWLPGEGDLSAEFRLYRLRV